MKSFASVSIRQAIAAVLYDTLKAHAPSLEPEDVERSFEIPREEKFGDLSSHVILKIAKDLGKPPRPLAEQCLAQLQGLLKKPNLSGRVEKITADGPGFLNFTYTPQETAKVLCLLEKLGEEFARPDLRPKKILLEFVSANPTGPLTVAHGRQAALGDSLARILKFCGHEVTKEYYNNDEGVQIQTLGQSLELRVRQLESGQSAEMPENYYRGEYLAETAKKMIQKEGPGFKKLSQPERLERCRDFAKNEILLGIQKDLADFGVIFDDYYSQKKLGQSGKVERTLEQLEKKGVTYEKDGAVWLRSTDFGDDKDRVLIKSDKTYTYLTPDISYHHEKFGRGFEELIDILGPDHHGYFARLRASQEALGHDSKRLHLLIAQLVTLYRGGEKARMSTRAGEFVTLRQVMDEVGRDAGRFYFVMRKFDAHLDFDLELAKSQTPDNPVFYVQYAHARIESMKQTFLQKGYALEKPPAEALLGLLKDPSELRVLRLISQYREVIASAEKTLEPYRLVPYLLELAGAFHKFYTDCRVVTEEEALSQARMRLSLAVQRVLRSGLQLLGVTAPVKM